jgi:hypothetical protein
MMETNDPHHNLEHHTKQQLCFVFSFITCTHIFGHSVPTHTHTAITTKVHGKAEVRYSLGHPYFRGQEGRTLSMMLQSTILVCYDISIKVSFFAYVVLFSQILV